MTSVLMQSSPSPSKAAQSMSDALSSASPEEALLSMASASEECALMLSRELSAALTASSTVGVPQSAQSRSNASTRNTESNADGKRDKAAPSAAHRYPVPFPKTLLAEKRNAATADVRQERHDDEHDSRIQTAVVCSESILASLSKVASGGSQASGELRDLEIQRRSVDAEADDIHSALRLRELACVGTDALGSRRYADAARAVQNYRMLDASERALLIVGPHTRRAHERTMEVLQSTILDMYETAVANSDLAALSELTPLLGMLQLADKGVALYLRYSQTTLSQIMTVGLEDDAQADQNQLQHHSQPLQRQKEPSHKPPATLCLKLAKIYNAAVTHLRHHLPMVAYALGEADGDAALVQLVHIEVEKRAVSIINDYSTYKGLSKLQARADKVSNQIEDRYISGVAVEDMHGEDSPAGTMMRFMGLGIDADHKSAPLTPQRLNPQLDMDDCGFSKEVGKLVDVNAFMEEIALLLQHTESYERFIRHAVDEVNKARELRKQQQEEVKVRQKQMELEKLGRDGISGAIEQAGGNNETSSKPLEILPPYTQLNDVVAEVGGYYSVLERALLLAGMQRAFLDVNYPDDRNYSPISIVVTGRARDAPGCRALQTSVVEECFYAAQRSTLRAFATGHTGTAAAAANYCADTLGRLLLEVMSRRAEMGAAMLKPGEGLLFGQAGLGQAALAVMSSAQKGLSKAAAARKGGAHASLDSIAAERQMIRQRIEMGISRACANLNDLEVAVDYTRRLESKFLQEIESSYPRSHHSTEQLRICIKSLSSVTDSFRNSSNHAVDELVAIVMPRIRSIVNDAVGQESTTGASFSTVMSGGVATTNNVRMNYDLDEAAYELTQISEGYISRLCTNLDELIDPLRLNLAPRLSDALVIGILGGASKRLESAIRRNQFTAFGALALDSDIRYFVNFAKERFDSPELTSNVTLYKTCTPLARLTQIAHLMNVDDLEDVIDLISTKKSTTNWDLTLEDSKTFLKLRADFEGRKVNELLQISDTNE